MFAGSLPRIGGRWSIELAFGGIGFRISWRSPHEPLFRGCFVNVCVLLGVDFNAAHGIGSGRKQAIQLLADEYTFSWAGAWESRALRKQRITRDHRAVP
jgi:hypothetical protein